MQWMSSGNGGGPGIAAGRAPRRPEDRSPERHLWRTPADGARTRGHLLVDRPQPIAREDMLDDRPQANKRADMLVE
ncbi:hypothetical protein EDF22_1069 [Rathayibacter sp. PhB127]|nr:hypothetical protein EDF22_1069 [Rathayibacter sp. PhB127]